MIRSKYLAIVILLATAICIIAPHGKTKSKSSRSPKSESTSDICSPNYNCRLKQKTRQKIQSKLDDNGVCFDDCKVKCLAVLRGRKSGDQCECYCSLFHDPCPSVTELPETEDYVCRETLEETCVKEGRTRSTALIKSKTLRKIKKVDVSSEDCESQCLEKLNPKSKSMQKRSKQCSCFCFYHQVCLSRQTTAEITTTQSTASVRLPITEAPTTMAETTTTDTPSTSGVTTDATTAVPITFPPTTEQPTTDEGDITTTVIIVEPASTNTTPIPITTETMMTTEAITTEATTTEATTTEATTTEATTTEATTTEATTTEATTTEATTTEATTTEATTTEATTTEATTTEATTTEATTTEGVTTADPLLLMDPAAGAA